MNTKAHMQTSMGPRKNEFHLLYLYFIFTSFCSLFMKFLFKSCKKRGEEKLLTNVFGYYVQQSRNTGKSMGKFSSLKGE